MFLTEEELHQILAGSVTTLNEVLTRVNQQAVENTLRMLPSVVHNLVIQVSDLKETTDKFYKDHPELSSHKNFVAQALEKVEGQNPGMSTSDLLNRALPEVKKLIANSQDLQSREPNKPSLGTLDHLTNMFED